MEELGVRNRPPAKVELEKLKAKLLHLQIQTRKQEQEIMEDEKQYYDLEARRLELTEKRDQGAAGQALTVDSLHEHREKWKAKLIELYASNKVKLRPLIEHTAEKQEQVSHMEMKQLGRNL
eukprot:s6_g3.t1